MHWPLQEELAAEVEAARRAAAEREVRTAKLAEARARVAEARSAALLRQKIEAVSELEEAEVELEEAKAECGERSEVLAASQQLSSSVTLSNYVHSCIHVRVRA